MEMLPRADRGRPAGAAVLAVHQHARPDPRPRSSAPASPIVELRGDTVDRATPVARFQAGEVPLFLISLKAGGVGLNLTAADTVILYDPWWNPAVEAQAMDRAHRIGQDKPVFVYKLIAEGTIEERMLALQERKRALAAGVLGQAVRQARGLRRGRPAGPVPALALRSVPLDQPVLPQGAGADPPARGHPRERGRRPDGRRLYGHHPAARAPWTRTS